MVSKPGCRIDDIDDAIVEVPEDVKTPEPSHKTTTDNDPNDTTKMRRSRKAGGESQADTRGTLTMRISKSLSNFFLVIISYDFNFFFPQLVSFRLSSQARGEGGVLFILTLGQGQSCFDGLQTPESKPKSETK